MADVTDTYYAVEDAMFGYGFQLEMGDGASPEAFQAIAAVVSITPGAMQTADLIRTHLRSPDAHQEHMPGLRDSGAFTCELRWLPNDETQSNTGGGSGAFSGGGLIAVWRERTTHNFRIMIQDGSPQTPWPFRAYVSQFQPGGINNDAVINATASFQPTQAYDTDLP